MDGWMEGGEGGRDGRTEGLRDNPKQAPHAARPPEADVYSRLLAVALRAVGFFCLFRVFFELLVSSAPKGLFRVLVFRVQGFRGSGFRV